jgi:hypothetical protein
MLILKAFHFTRNKRQRAQSFVELAIALPIVLLILLGMIEVVFFVARYLDVMDLTREAARFASLRSAGTESGTEVYSGSFKCGDQSVGKFNFFYHTACLFAPPNNAVDPDFRYTANDLVFLNQDTDDVVIQIFSVNGRNHVDKVFPPTEPWALSEHDGYTSKFRAASGVDANWKRDCNGLKIPLDLDPVTHLPIPLEPHYTAKSVTDMLGATYTGPGTPTPDTLSSPMNKGFVAVEFYYCYNQVLFIPIANWFVPNPMRIHAYTIMPNPASQPTITPYVTSP